MCSLPAATMRSEPVCRRRPRYNTGSCILFFCAARAWMVPTTLRTRKRGLSLPRCEQLVRRTARSADGTALAEPYLLSPLLPLHLHLTTTVTVSASYYRRHCIHGQPEGVRAGLGMCFCLSMTVTLNVTVTVDLTVTVAVTVADGRRSCPRTT